MGGKGKVWGRVERGGLREKGEKQSGGVGVVGMEQEGGGGGGGGGINNRVQTGQRWC